MPENRHRGVDIASQQFQIPHGGAKKAGLKASYKKNDDRHDTWTSTGTRLESSTTVCTVQYSTVAVNGIRLALTESEHLSGLAL